MNTKKNLHPKITMSYVKWLIDSYKGSNIIVLSQNDTLKFWYNYTTKKYHIESFDECLTFTRRITAINNWYELCHNLGYES